MCVSLCVCALVFMCVCLTIGGADEGEAGDDPEEGHGDDDDDDVLKERAALLSLNPAGPQPIRTASGLSSSAVSCLSDLRRHQHSHESHILTPSSLID